MFDGFIVMFFGVAAIYIILQFVDWLVDRVAPLITINDSYL